MIEVIKRSFDHSGRGFDLNGFPAVSVVCLILFVAKLCLLDPVGPLIFFDEYLYMEGARALAEFKDYPSGQYPYGYPLLISPSLFFGFGYDGVFILNCFFGSLLPISVWLISREISSQRSFLCSVISCFIPFNYIYPTQVMSENLYIPLFCFCFWFAIKGRVESRVSPIIYGSILSFVFLTKYIALPGVVLLLVFWVVNIFANTRSLSASLSSFFSAAIGAAFVITLWVTYARGSGIGLSEAFGGNVSGLKAGDLISLDSVFTWAVLYFFGFVLLCGPFIAGLLMASFEFSGKIFRFSEWNAADKAFLLFLMLASGYVLICIQHSVGALMNYPTPQRIIIRYLMHLTPLALVIGMSFSRSISFSRALVVGVISAGAVFISWSVFYGNGFFELTPWFASIPLYSSDIMVYKPYWAVASVVAFSALYPLFYFSGFGFFVFSSILAVIFSFSGFVFLKEFQRESSVKPLHVKELSAFIKDYPHDVRFIVRSELRRFPLIDVRQSLVFWGVSNDRFEVIGKDQVIEKPDDDVVGLVLTTEKRAYEPLKTYLFGRKIGYIYKDEFNDSGQEGEFSPLSYVNFEVDDSCSGGGSVKGRVSWDFRNIKAGSVYVYISKSGGPEQLFASGSRIGSQVTGKWVDDSTHFKFRSGDTGMLLKIYSPKISCN